MRHLRSILYAVVLAPAVWVLCGVGFTGDLTGRARDSGFTVEIGTGLLLLLLAGAAYAILLYAPISPAGPALLGLVFAGLALWALAAPQAYAGAWSPGVSKEGFDLSLPGYGLAFVLAVPMLCTALSARRWARYEAPVLPLIGTLGRARGTAAVAGEPMAQSWTAVLPAPGRGQPVDDGDQATTVLRLPDEEATTLLRTPGGDAAERTQVLLVPDAAERDEPVTQDMRAVAVDRGDAVTEDVRGAGPRGEAATLDAHGEALTLDARGEAPTEDVRGEVVTTDLSGDAATADVQGEVATRDVRENRATSDPQGEATTADVSAATADLQAEEAAEDIHAEPAAEDLRAEKDIRGETATEDLRGEEATEDVRGGGFAVDQGVTEEVRIGAETAELPGEEATADLRNAQTTQALHPTGRAYGAGPGEKTVGQLDGPGEQTQVIPHPSSETTRSSTPESGTVEPPGERTQVITFSAPEPPTTPPSIIGAERPDPGADPTTRLVPVRLPAEPQAPGPGEATTVERPMSVLDMERPADESEDGPRTPAVPAQRRPEND